MFKYAVESELHDFVLENFNNYFEFPLKANEFELSKGRIDFLGEDKEALYVIELKKDKIDKHAIKQLQKYIETMQSDFPGRVIKGIATAPELISTLDISSLPPNIEVKILDDVYYNGKTRSLITLDDELKAELEKIAKEQNRSLNNLIETILKDYLKK